MVTDLEIRPGAFSGLVEAAGFLAWKPEEACYDGTQSWIHGFRPVGMPSLLYLYVHPACNAGAIAGAPASRQFGTWQHETSANSRLLRNPDESDDTAAPQQQRLQRRR